MLRWLYRVLFARRAVWILEHPDGSESGWLRLVTYDPDPADLERGHALVSPYLEMGWRVVSQPKED